MKKVLIIKISSMGDIIHTLPALSDAERAHPDICFDWVVAPSFAEIPKWHRAVNSIIPCPIRQWKHRWLDAYRHGEIKTFIHSLREQSYDLIIDAQSALKSAIISKIARGPVAGFDKKSVREYGAQWFYQKNYWVAKNQHAATRLRLLFSSVLGYAIHASTPLDFGIDREKLINTSLTLPEKYVLIIPNTTWSTKEWPMAHWQTLIARINQAGMPVVIPWGNNTEKKRAEMLSTCCKNASVLPPLSLSACANVIAHAKAAVCVDTGLGHLTAALQTPAIHLYGPTNPKKIGACGKRQTLLTSTVRCATACKKSCYHNEKAATQSVCLMQLTPDKVWETLQPLLYTDS